MIPSADQPCNNSTTEETKTVLLTFCGREVEWEGLMDYDSEWFGGLYCDEIEDIGIYMDDERITDEAVLEALNDNMRQNAPVTVEWPEVKGVRKHELKSAYDCSIEVCGEFDPSKLTLCIGVHEFIIGSEKMTDCQFEDPILMGVEYCGKSYDLEYISGTVKSAELIWGEEDE